MSSSLPELLAQFDRQRSKGYSVGARLSDPIIAALRAEVERLTNFGELARQAGVRADERARVAEQALTDLRGKVSDEYERAVTLCENSPSIGAGRILTGLWRLHITAGGASTTTPETENG